MIVADTAADSGLGRQPVEELVAQTRATYDGPLVVGEDLMAFDVGKMGVEVIRPR